MVTFFTVLLALVLIGTIAWLILPLRRRDAAGAADRDDSVANLIAAREAALQTIRELDFDYQLGNLDEADYQELRERHRRHAIALLKATNGRAVETVDPEDLAIERAVQAARQARADESVPAAAPPRNGSLAPAEPACATCGQPARPDDRFCSGCGARVEVRPPPAPQFWGEPGRRVSAASGGSVEAGEGEAAPRQPVLPAPVDERSTGARIPAPRPPHFPPYSGEDRHPAPPASPLPPQRWGGPGGGRTPRWLIAIGVAVVAVVAGVVWLTVAARTAQQDQRAIGQVPAEIQSFDALALTGDQSALLGHPAGLAVSRDGGRTWQPSGRTAPVRTIGAAPDRPGLVYAAGRDGVIKSQDGGQTWAPVVADLPAGAEVAAIAPGAAESIVAFVAGQGLYRSDDGGARWQPIGGSPPRAASGLALAGGRIFLATPDQGVLVSANGRAWANANGFVTGALPTLRISGIVYDARSGDTSITPDGETLTGALYAGTDQGLFKSIDGGSSWTRLPLQTDVAALALGPDPTRSILVVDRRGRVFRSDDRGLTWK